MCVQVNAKATALVQFLRELAGAPRAYALLQLAGRLASQCECQVALSHAFAFPLAEVAAAVAAAHPDLAPILLAKLHHVRPALMALSHWGIIYLGLPFRCQ